MWAVVLSRSGEKSAISIARHWAEDDKVRIIAELASINNVLARVRRESI
jgi:hypothetical protein